MLRALSYNFKLPRQFLETSIIAELAHKTLNIKYVWEVVSEIRLEGVTSGWHVLVHQKSQEEAKVLVSMEADPRQLVIENEARSHHFFSKVEWVDTMKLEVREV